MFDWLKVLIPGAKSGKKGKQSPNEGSHIKIDSRSYPLVTLSRKGFVAANFDDNIAVGQNAAISVEANDRWGKFSFATRCTITAVDSTKRFSGSFGILLPEIEQVLTHYAKNRGAAKPAK